MPKEQDRHLGRRENIWFPYEEHAAMLRAMEAIKETNKSVFIRSAVSNFIKALKEKGAMSWNWKYSAKSPSQTTRNGRLQTQPSVLASPGAR